MSPVSSSIGEHVVQFPTPRDNLAQADYKKKRSTASMRLQILFSNRVHLKDKFNEELQTVYAILLKSNNLIFHGDFNA